jgi:hypothetical protein
VPAPSTTQHHDTELRELIAATPWVDTHEHLVEERHRLAPDGYAFDTWRGTPARLPGDWTALIVGYELTDMVSAGLGHAEAARMLGDAIAPEEKWRVLAPYLERTRETGFGWALDETTQRLTGLRLAADTVGAIDERLRALRRPGYYATILGDHAGVRRCQVNSLDEDPACATELPELLDQDLSLVPLVLGCSPEIEARAGGEIDELADYEELMERCFADWAPRVVAVKCPWAYARPLAVRLDGEPPARAFRRLRAGDATPGDRRAVEDHLFLRALDLAAEHGLPVKLHVGYLTDLALPASAHVRDHVADAAALVRARPGNTFVLMHIGWPDHEQMLALINHHPNAVVDLCWAWSLAPMSTVEFVRRFLLAAPSNKLLGFGGDVQAVESIVGHAALARHGLALALEGLVADGWISSARACELVPRLMHENADAVLPTRFATTST